MKKKTVVLMPLFFGLVFLSSHLLGDDIEIFSNNIKGKNSKEIKPNVAVILDSSASMLLPFSEEAIDQVNDNVGGSDDDDYDEEDELDNIMPARAKPSRSDGRELFSLYKSNYVYPGLPNAFGGEGKQDFYYIYKKIQVPILKYFYHYQYYNKVHISQLRACASDADIQEKKWRIQYSANNVQWHAMCKEGDAACQYQPAKGGASVRCENRTDGDYYIFNSNIHNFLQLSYRGTVMQSTIKNILDLKLDVNLAFLTFATEEGKTSSYAGYVYSEFMDASVEKNIQHLKKKVDDLSFETGTPLTQTLWESYLYLTGQKPEFGSRYSIAASKDFDQYKSPIVHGCQQNHIVILSDGVATYDMRADSIVNDLENNMSEHCFHEDDADDDDDTCLDDLARWLSTDGKQKDGRRDHSDQFPGTQSITVHSIGFSEIDDDDDDIIYNITHPDLDHDDDDLLNAAARNGKGLFLSANNAQRLSDAILSVVGKIEMENGTFVAPAVAVDTYSSLKHRNELYYALFQPSASLRWNGNIKKFKIVNGEIRDSRNNPAINPSTGYFYKTSRSFWSQKTDGEIISEGGFAHKLKLPEQRVIYTYTNPNVPSDVILSELLDKNNARITADMLGIEPGVNQQRKRSAVIDWAKGASSRPDRPNHFVSDFIHNRPVVVTYTPDQLIMKKSTHAYPEVVFAASNMGFFYAIDALTGEEIFSFIPAELLKNLTAYYDDTALGDEKVYGLDSTMAVSRFDANNDGTIRKSDGDHVYLYQAMRRGGNRIYALDVTDVSAPRLMWQINGGSPAFKDLAQTWSVPKLGFVKGLCGGKECKKEVLFFGGGYDTRHDTSVPAGSDGNALYMVDAKTGERLWSAGADASHALTLTQMIDSVAADVTVADINSDGYVDFLFAIDLRGRIWRIDFSGNIDNNSFEATGGDIAYLGSSGLNPRRFYNAIDVAYVSERGFKPFLALSVASGYRAHPLNVATDNFLFVVFDRHIKAPTASQYGHYVDDKRPVNSDDLILADDSVKISVGSARYGWKKELGGPGEKGLTRTTTFNNKIILNTYLPEDNSKNTSCAFAGAGEGRQYALDLLTGASMLKAGDNTLNYKKLKRSGIPSEPVIIFSTTTLCPDGKTTCKATEMIEKTVPIVCTGTECSKDMVDTSLKKSFWREK